MKVFFTASQRGKSYFDFYYKKIFKIIKSLGYELIDDEIISIPSKSFYETLEKEGKKGDKELYKTNLKNIREADINIFDCSMHSLSIGFMIDKSLELNKPTIALFLEEHDPHFLEGIEEDKLIIRSYTDTSLPKIIKESLNIARNKKDKRFNFFVTPNLLTYLEKESKKRNITKSTFIRNLIFDHMHHNKENDS
ncbi:MAG: hypothetical protein UT63_C0011G0010 [Candidatus Gottesmanbacteria bacterium GW2011_GWC2_39_8]|uniref:Ribbon-helix-helix protein CopG domain-containing protein n=1 Tax=Candidatus Gottesmanbacteria bacterium GW2011_GWC2_39_8 TaxID=1618450 RepID=A0A0G0Q115_9BACT|nr:MAG: hypothetical protein UT63_C0011G0010 [Candidatus Gottesmanbacteria bacterium GW2011_GWC2_39_8]